MKSLMEASLKELDPQIDRIREIEEERQNRKIIMIASESIAPRAVREALSTVFGNLYAEGYPSTRMCRSWEEEIFDFAHFIPFYRRYGSRRYYKGVEYADFVEGLAMRRASVLFSNDAVPPEGIYANVQPLSGASANNAVYSAFVSPGDCVMGMDLTHGGHLTHGHEVNRSGKYYTIVHYRVGSDGKLDYEAMKRIARREKPKMIIAGFSAYPWDIDWKKMREVADSVAEGGNAGHRAILFADIAHTAGLISAGVVGSPVGYADVISMTTHKTLCGPRGAIILTVDRIAAERVDMAVFPGEQGGPHINQIAAKAVAFKIAMTDEFKELMRKVVENARALAQYLKEEGIPLAYGGTDTHMLLIDLRRVETSSGEGLSGEIASRLLDMCNITCNKNTIKGDTSAFEPGAIRLGTTWVTQRGFGTDEMRVIAKLVAKVLRQASSLKYVGTCGDLVRAKISPSIIDETRKEVEKLIEKVEGRVVRKESYPHFYFYSLDDGSNVGAIEVRGSRAQYLLEQVLSGCFERLEQGRAVKMVAFDFRGEKICNVLVQRSGSNSPKMKRFYVFPESNGKKLLGILRGYSDGYLQADEGDIYKKVYGPATIEEIEEGKAQQLRRIAESNTISASSEFDLRKGFFTGRDVAYKKFTQTTDIRIIKSEYKKKKFEWTETKRQPRKTCLYSEHLKIVKKARLVEFAGWVLPVWFSSIAGEHSAVRRKAGLFDVSHMGVMEFSGEDAEKFLDITTTAFVPAIQPGQAKYSYLLSPDGRVIDDIMIYRISWDRFIVVVNAANAEEDEAWWRAVASREYLIDYDNPSAEFTGNVRIRNLKDSSCGGDMKVDIALQGPMSLKILEKVIEDREFIRRMRQLKRFELTEGELCNERVIVATTGYTGEPVGFEILLHPEHAPVVWRKILEVGSEFGMLPAGLGARDSTRIEAGLPLHGHELAGQYNINPVEAGYGSFVKIHKPFFIGRKAMVEAVKNPARVIVRFMTEGKGLRLTRAGHIVVEGKKGRYAGVVVSCTLVGRKEVGMALIDSKFAGEGSPLGIFTFSDSDGKPSGKNFSQMGKGDFLPVSKWAKILSRFPDPANPFPEEAAEAE